MIKRQDLIAGLSVAGLIMPEAAAYSAIAGLSAEHAILAAIAGAATYAFVGRSRFAVLSPTSSSAAVLAVALGGMATSADSKALLAVVATLLVGATFIAAGFLRLGALTSFVSRPVLRGFALGLAITIIVKQLPVIAGVGIEASAPWPVITSLVSAYTHWNWASIATGLIGLAVLLLLRRSSKWPATLILLALGIGASLLLHLSAKGVETVGQIHLSWQMSSFSALSGMNFASLAELTMLLMVVLLAESWGTMRTLALRHGENLDANHELKAIGMANISAAVVQGMPVGAGFSASSANEASGAHGRTSGLIAACGVLALILIAGDAVAYLPKPILAAIVIAALLHALDPRPFVRLWHLHRDFTVAICAIVAVLALGVLDGLLLSLILSLALLIRRISSPHITRLARLGDHDYVDYARHPEAFLPQNVMIWRPAEPLFFGNAEGVFAAIDRAQKAQSDINAVVVSLEQSFDLDSSAFDALMEFDARLATRGATLRLARIRDTIRDLLTAANTNGLAERCFFSVDDAVAGHNPLPANPNTFNQNLPSSLPSKT